MVYKIDDLSRSIMKRLNIHPLNDELYPMLESEWGSLQEMVEHEIVKAAIATERDSPLDMKEGFEQFDGEIEWDEPVNPNRRIHSGRLLLPDDFCTFCGFRMSDWQCHVERLTPSGAIEHILTQSDVDALGATPRRPICILEPSK